MKKDRKAEIKVGGGATRWKEYGERGSNRDLSF
jgi:hypothetical protein